METDFDGSLLKTTNKNSLFSTVGIYSTVDWLAGWLAFACDIIFPSNPAQVTFKEGALVFGNYSSVTLYVERLIH